MSFKCSITLEDISWEKGIKKGGITSLIDYPYPNHDSCKAKSDNKIHIYYFSQNGLFDLLKSLTCAASAPPHQANRSTAG